MLIHFEEIVAHTEQEVSELSDQLKDVLETKELIQDMIEQLKEEVFKKGE
jgi:chromosome segregation ATPase